MTAEGERGPTREYSNGEITVLWRADLCSHSGRCFLGLPTVFDPRRRPWVDMAGAASEAIATQVRRCPSGALSLSGAGAAAAPAAESQGAPEPAAWIEIEVRPNGPLVVHGRLRIKTSSGETIERETRTSFCRCGGSANKPFCDSTHRRNGFTG